MAEKKSAGAEMIAKIAADQAAAAAEAAKKQAEKDAKAQEKRARDKAREDKLHHRELLMKVSGLNITQLAQQKRDESALAERKQQLEELKSSMEAMGLSVEGNKKIAKEEAKIAKAEIKLQTQNKSSLSKLVNFLTPGGAGDKEKENQDNRRFAKTMAVFGSIKDGIGSVASSMAEKGKAIGGGMFDILKKGALFLAIPALIAFMRSPMFDDLKTWITDKLIPALKKITDEIIIPVAMKIWDWVNGTAMPAMVDFVVRQFEAITNLFTNIKARFDGWSEMSFKEKIFAVLGVFEDLGTFVMDTATNMFIAIFDMFGLDGSAMAEKYIAPIRNAISAVIDWIALAFTDPKAALDALWSGIKSLGKWLYDNTILKAWNWIKEAFTFNKTDVESEDSKKGVFGFIKDLAVGVWDWFKSLFDFSTIGSTFASIVNFITLPYNILFSLAKGVWDWFKGLFGFENTKTDEAEVVTKPGGIGGMLLSLITGVWNWFKGLFGWGKSGDDVKPAESEDSKKGVTGFLLDMVTGIWTWFKGLFDFSSFGAGIKSVAKLIFLPYTALFDMIDAIWVWFKGLFGFSSDEADKDPRSGSDKVLDFIVALPGKLWAWLKKTVLGWFGLAKEGDKIVAEVEDVNKPEEGWISKLFSAIFPEWLLSPVDWIMKKLGLKDAEGKITDKGAGVQAVIVAEGGIGGAIAKLFSDIFPEWITSPIQWIKGKLGLEASKPMEFEFPGFPTIADIKEFLPEWLTDPIGWVKGFFGGKDDPVPDSVITEATSKHGQTLKGAKEAGLYDPDWAGASEINKEALAAGVKSGAIQEEMLQAIIDDKDLRDEDLQFMKTLVEQATTGESLHVRDIGLHRRLDRILSNTGQNAAVIASHQLRAGMDFARMSALAGTGPVGGTSGQVVNNIVNSVPMTTTNVANTRVNTAIGVNDPFTNVAVAY